MAWIDFSQISQIERYKLITSSVVPRPIAWVSTLSPAGVTNLAPFSFFNGVASNPATIMISIARKSDGAKKDTLINIESTKEFVVNSACLSDLEQVVNSAIDYEYQESEIDRLKINVLPSTFVRPPRLEQARISFECRLYKQLEIGDSTVGSSTIVVGEILGLHIAEQCLKEGKIKFELLNPLARLGGISYGATAEYAKRAVPAKP